MLRTLKLLFLLLSAPAVCFGATVIPSDQVVSHVNVRTSPNTQATVVASLLPGDNAEYLATASDWYRVKLNTGSEGYVHKRWTVLSNNDLTIHFIDVGHGDATLVNCPNGNNILVDAGSSSGYPGGKLRYYLLKQGGIAGKPLEALIITHPDSSNFNLATRALDKVPVKKVYLVGTEDNYGHEKFSGWLTKIEQNRKIFLASDYFNAEQTPNAEISCGDAQVHILAASVLSDQSPKNALSIVLMIRYGDFEALLTGDATTATEDIILGRFSKEWLESDVLKIGQHGSLTTSTGGPWAKAIKPKTAIVSAGSENSDGHPHKQVIERLEPYTLNKQNAHAMEYATWDSAKKKYIWHSPRQYSEAIYSTATNGNIVVKSDGRSFKVYVDGQK